MRALKHGRSYFQTMPLLYARDQQSVKNSYNGELDSINLEVRDGSTSFVLGHMHVVEKQYV